MRTAILVNYGVWLHPNKTLQEVLDQIVLGTIFCLALLKHKILYLLHYYDSSSFLGIGQKAYVFTTQTEFSHNVWSL